METINFLRFYISSNVVLIISLLLIYFYYTNTSLLKKRGFNQEFIKFKKKDYSKRILGLIIAIPVIELISGLITYLIFDELSDMIHLMVAFILFVVLIIPFAIIDNRFTAKQQNELMQRTRSLVAVDLNHRIFHLVFNPFLEIAAVVLVLTFFIGFIEFISPLILVHIALIWFIYLMIRRMRNMNKPLIRESYYFTFLILAINHLLVIFHIVYPIFNTPECCKNEMMIITGLNLSILLMLKIGYYLFKLPQLKRELK